MVYNRDETTRIEGGDELVLSKDVLAVGISQRTDAASIEKLLVNIFERGVGFKKVQMHEFANSRKFMHLDTVFTMVDYDKFTIQQKGREFIFFSFLKKIYLLSKSCIYLLNLRSIIIGFFGFHKKTSDLVRLNYNSLFLIILYSYRKGTIFICNYIMDFI